MNTGLLTRRVDVPLHLKLLLTLNSMWIWIIHSICAVASLISVNLILYKWVGEARGGLFFIGFVDRGGEQHVPLYRVFLLYWTM